MLIVVRLTKFLCLLHADLQESFPSRPLFRECLVVLSLLFRFLPFLVIMIFYSLYFIRIKGYIRSITGLNLTKQINCKCGLGIL